MKPILQKMAEALLERQALELRELVHDWWRQSEDPMAWAEPVSADHNVRVAAAALAELLAMQAGVAPPAWTARVGALPQPFYALAAASRLRSVRELCDRESPAPLQKRGILAPAGFLQVV